MFQRISCYALPVLDLPHATMQVIFSLGACDFSELHAHVHVKILGAQSLLGASQFRLMIDHGKNVTIFNNMKAAHVN